MIDVSWLVVVPTKPGTYIHVSNWHWEVIEIEENDTRKWFDDSEFYGPIPLSPSQIEEQNQFNQYPIGFRGQNATT